MSRSVRAISAQRRPEHKLRRHRRRRARRIPRWAALNEGRSISSGDTADVVVEAPPFPRPLNEGRSISSGDTRRSSPARGACSSLNEGRSISSGDTVRRTVGWSAATSAQRRPEHKLRRHDNLDWWPARFRGAQRRPEHKLRRHVVVVDAVNRAVCRSTKAGA